ncbi:MAG: MmcQ/YjbR family DNA-binding protein [Acidimicrobiia bacterium]|nr:MmcQ/YjbR family DNA-binding protein [Acidimicrobiia bacterium]
MNRSDLVKRLEGLPGAKAGHPFGPDALVFKVGSRMFGIVSEDEPLRLSLKCDPDFALELRAQYGSVAAGYHLNKRHWNTITIDGEVPDDEIVELMEHSHGLVLDALPKRVRQIALEGLHSLAG